MYSMTTLTPRRTAILTFIRDRIAQQGQPTSLAEIAMARRAGMLAAEVLAMIEPHVVAGASTETLDRIWHDHIVNV